ncbi:MAG TPA: hypothetical protein PK335_14960, partial [Draconibacterium sp.]|nr:hypothetical protein [Draconibacterium sp.]
LLLQGLPEMNLENVKLKNMFFRSDKGMIVIDASDIEMDNINLATKDDKAIEIINASNVKITGLDYPFKTDSAISIKGGKCGDISISGVNQQSLKEFVKIGDEVSKKKVKLE